VQKFNLTIFRQSRVLFALFLFPVIFVSLILLGAKLNNFIIGILLFVVYLFVAYYYVVGYLTISIDNEQIKFSWNKKFIFNYTEINSIRISDINTVVIDNGQLIRKINTNLKTIKINNTKIQQKDASKFLSQLNILIEHNNIRVIDSWDEWYEKGYLKTAYRINTVILFLTAIIVTYTIITRGFKFNQLFMISLFFPQLFLYGKQMKYKLKQKKKNYR